jgi:hypothetical protein
MRKFLIISVVWILLSAVGYIALNLDRHNQEVFLNRYDLAGKDVVEIINLLEEKTDEPFGFSAGVNAKKLRLSDAKDTVEFPIPEGKFYLSVAPYINQTHPCAIHNLVTCTGELQNESFDILITDVNTNEVVLSEQRTSTAKGFIGLWLPSDKNLQISITYQGLSATKQVGTFDSNDTCETTMQLS